MKNKLGTSTSELGEEVEAQLRAETEAAEPQLAKLISFARELMLKKTADTGTPSIVGEFDRETFDSEIESQFESVLDLGADPATVLAIERFGADLLTEAFECFGEEGPKLVEQFKNAKDVVEKLAVAVRLEEIVNEIADKASHQFKEEDSTTHRYSPIRLSPQLIGAYPDTVLRPTCLGKSILITSFYAKLRLPLMHSGVLLSAQHKILNDQRTAIEVILDEANHPHHPLSTTIRESLEATRLANAAAVTIHNGFHAATFAELEEGIWIQHDPNYGSALVEGLGAKRLDETYGNLMMLHEDTYSTAETRLMLTEDDDGFFIDLAEKVGAVLPALEEIDQLLQATESDEVYEALFEKIFLPLLPLAPEGKDSVARLKVKELFMRAFSLGDFDYQTYPKKTAEYVLDKYAFVDIPRTPPAVIERCKNDVNYRQQIVANLCVTPLMFVLKMQSDWFLIKKIASNLSERNHTCVDLALPEYRIAMCVLSDTAGYYGDDLPLSSWLAYWPSDVSLVEHAAQTLTKAQKLLGFHSLRRTIGKGFNLTYPAVYTILK